MDATRLVGFVIVAIGLLSGMALVAQPFVAAIDAAAPATGLLFVGGLAVGLPLYATGSDRQQALRLAGGALLVIGLGALAGLFVDALGIRSAERSTALLWLLAPAGLAGGLLLGYFAGALDRLAGKAR